MPNIRQSYLFVLPWGLDTTGGVNQVVTNLTRQFDMHKEYVPLLLINSWEHKSITEKNCDNQRHFYFRMRSPWDADRPIINLISFIREFPRNLIKLRAFLSKEKIKAINVHYPGLFFYQCLILKLLGVFNGKIILSYHGSDIRTAEASRGIERQLHKFMINCSDLIVVCSTSLKDDISSFMATTLQKVKVVHNGMDDAYIIKEKSCAVYFDKLKTDSFLLSIATYEEKKGLDVLIKAFSVIAKENNNLSLVLVGRSTAHRLVLVDLVNELGLSGRVLLLGEMHHGQATAWLEKAEIFILPSRYEPFGIVLLEAGLFSVPVIASNIGGIPEIITHNQTGLLVESDNPEQLVNAIRELLTSPDKRSLLGANLRDHVLNNFTWKQAYEKYVDLI